MTNPVNDGGPAFPYDEKNDDGSYFRSFSGISKREWFAGQALAGMLAHHTRYKARDGRTDWHSAVSEEAYEIADAMLAARCCDA